jgi:PIN domain nuclease of toxin-antitoxin system
VLRAVVDTHAVIWYLYADNRLSATARDAMEDMAASGDQLAISAITLAEIVYLSERGRLDPRTLDRLLEEMSSDQTLMVEIPIDRAIILALRQIPKPQIPELPDRLIAATARHLNLPLITRDLTIQTSSIATIW